MLGVWVMSKSYAVPSGIHPVAWSYGNNHSASGYEANGWGLVWVSMDIHQLQFVKSGMDARVEFVGRGEGAKPTPLLLETYAGKLDASEHYTTLGQVLDKLGESEPRFWLERDPHKP